ncbi:MAG: ankyrin repeat domain-containing protein, partial [Rhodocyclaceae bacterium]|nr:ankyrin repeat domain-containing protein [Rhodocyclaceae bacterium]
MMTHHRSHGKGVLGDVLRRYQELPQFTHIELARGDEKGLDEQTPLHVACYRGDEEAVLAMISAGASIGARGDIGGTPLHEA